MGGRDRYGMEIITLPRNVRHRLLRRMAFQNMRIEVVISSISASLLRSSFRSFKILGALTTTISSTAGVWALLSSMLAARCIPTTGTCQERRIIWMISQMILNAVEKRILETAYHLIKKRYILIFDLFGMTFALDSYEVMLHTSTV
jgi:hypothetical protein